MQSTARARVGVLGASGYMGGEALRVIIEHPGLELAWATSRQPRPAHFSHPDLRGMGIDFVHPDDKRDDHIRSSTDNHMRNRNSYWRLLNA